MENGKCPLRVPLRLLLKLCQKDAKMPVFGRNWAAIVTAITNHHCYVCYVCYVCHVCHAHHTSQTLNKQ